MNNPEDRRRERRLDNHSMIFVEVCSTVNDHQQADIILCSSLDISPHGIQVQLDTDVATGTILRLCADFGQQSDPIYLYGECKWARPEGELFNIGLELLDAENSDLGDWRALVDNQLES